MLCQKLVRKLKSEKSFLQKKIMDSNIREILKNHYVTEVTVVEEDKIVLNLNDTWDTLVFSTSSNCCGHAYFQNCENLQDLVGKNIQNVELRDNLNEDDDDNLNEDDDNQTHLYTDRTIITVITTYGDTIQFFMMCQHNGYYPAFLNIYLEKMTKKNIVSPGSDETKVYKPHSYHKNIWKELLMLSVAVNFVFLGLWKYLTP